MNIPATITLQFSSLTAEHEQEQRIPAEFMPCEPCSGRVGERYFAWYVSEFRPLVLHRRDNEQAQIRFFVKVIRPMLDEMHYHAWQAFVKYIEVVKVSKTRIVLYHPRASEVVQRHGARIKELLNDGLDTPMTVALTAKKDGEVGA